MSVKIIVRKDKLKFDFFVTETVRESVNMIKKTRKGNFYKKKCIFPLILISSG